MVGRLKRIIIAAVPNNVSYDLSAILMQTSFETTLAEIVRQIGASLGRKPSYECLADMVEASFETPQNIPDAQTIRAWCTGIQKPRYKAAKELANAFRIPQEYLTRFYSSERPPAYEKS